MTNLNKTAELTGVALNDGLYMTDKELIEALRQDREDNYAIDEACYKRLRRLAADYGKDGKIADDLLDVVRRLLDL
jgi:hypothetical protein